MDQKLKQTVYLNIRSILSQYYDTLKPNTVIQTYFIFQILGLFYVLENQNKHLHNLNDLELKTQMSESLSI